jgi:branched-chain amino acid transport system substrate-binding protein
LHRIALVFLGLAASARAELRIGAYCPLTGGSSEMGVSMRNGVQLAADEINASGGVLGQQIAIVFRDDESSPEKGAKIVRELIEKEKVAAILGPCNTAVANASVQAASERHVPLIVNVSTGAKVNELLRTTPHSYIFRLAASDAIQAEMVVKEAVDMRGHKRVALIDDDTGYGKTAEGHVIAALALRRLQPAYVGTFRIKDIDMSAQVAAAHSAGADVVIAFGIGPELGALANSMRKAGWTADLLGSWHLGSQPFARIAGESAEGVTMPATFIEATARTTRQRAFVANYEKRFQENPMVLAPAAAQAYDSLHLLALAIAQAGSMDGALVKAALEDLKSVYDGITTRYQRPYTPKDHEAIDAQHVLLARVKHGRLVPIWEY